MTVRLRAGAATDPGRVRSVNQDSYRLVPERDLFIVADGMGGHRGGEVAAAMAVERIDACYDEATPTGLRDAVLAANTTIYDRSVDDADLRGMGTTAVVAALVRTAGTTDGDHDHGDHGGVELGADHDPADDAGTAQADADDGAGVSEPDGDGDEPVQVVIANVGDSRAYVYRDHDLIQLTEDHSMVADLVRQGQISQDEADVHPQRNIVTRVLGVYEHIEVDLWPVDPVTGDRFVLCSDGLFNEVGAEAIGAVLRRLDDPTEAAEELVRLANEGGGRDNITVVIVDVVDDGGAAATASGALGRAGHSSDPDLAGFGSATKPAGEAPGPTDAAVAGATEVPGTASRRRGVRARVAERRAERSRTRFTWRVALFLVLIAAVLGGAYATVVWYGTSTFFVGYEDDDVVIYRGRPGGLLWIDPSVEETTVLSRDEVPARYARSIAGGREYSDLDDARRFVENIREEAGLDERGVPTTTTTRPPTTTTTDPDAVADPDDTAAAGDADPDDATGAGPSPTVTG